MIRMFDLTEEIEKPVRKIEAGERISDSEALALVDAPLSLLGLLATRATTCTIMSV